MNYVAKLNFGNALASVASPKVISEVLRDLLAHQELWTKIEPFSLPPGVCGSKAFDQANIVREIKDYDSKKGNRVAAFGLSDRVLWNYVYRELQKVFTCSHGRVLGLLEYKRPTEENPDAKDPGYIVTGMDGSGNGGDIE
jgi:hypothetical protein